MAGALALPAIFTIAHAADAPRKAPPKPPLGLIAVQFPKDNPWSAEKAELGRILYFDPRLSGDNTVSCASCHMPSKGFGDGRPVSTGIRGQKGGRNAPTVINRAYSGAQFWDGRAPSLEEQAKGPIANPIEMGQTHEAMTRSLQNIEGYRKLFKQVFGTETVTIDDTAKAIATFERTVLSGNSPYDRYKAGDKKAMSPAQVRGMTVFFDKGKCDVCHEGVNFTLNMYANLGVGINKPEPDLGRFVVTKNPADWGAFKTPTLRDIEHTGPYMHDGSIETLEEVVEYYDRGGTPNKNLDARMKPLHLTAQEKSDLVAFLKALSGEGWQNIKPPAQFPQ